jgi:uncharacterized protein YceH (UPF0502 family)
MDLLTDVDVRVLGSLIEKEITTPDNYPLSLNALVNACNQLSNREPVVSYDDPTVSASLDRLRRQSLARGIQRSDSRVTKYQHLVRDALGLSTRELAVLGVLMLRGPQTLGEIRTRGSRLADLESLTDVETIISMLADRSSGPLVAVLPRQPGQKDVRYAHLLSGEPVLLESDSPAEDARSASRASNDDRVQAVSDEVAELRKEVADLRAQLESFRKQFE